MATRVTYDKTVNKLLAAGPQSSTLSQVNRVESIIAMAEIGFLCLVRFVGCSDVGLVTEISATDARRCQRSRERRVPGIYASAGRRGCWGRRVGFALSRASNMMF